MSDTKERRLKITPGTWYTTKAVYDDYPTVQVFAPFYVEAVHWRKPKAGHTRTERVQQNADAELIADAGATANEVDMLPSELLAKLREVEGCLVRSTSYLNTLLAMFDNDGCVYPEQSMEADLEQEVKDFLSSINLPKS